MEPFPTGLVLGAIGGAYLATFLVSVICASDNQLLLWALALLLGWVLGVFSLLGVIIWGSKDDGSL